MCCHRRETNVNTSQATYLINDESAADRAHPPYNAVSTNDGIASDRGVGRSMHDITFTPQTAGITIDRFPHVLFYKR